MLYSWSDMLMLFCRYIPEKGNSAGKRVVLPNILRYDVNLKIRTFPNFRITIKSSQSIFHKKYSNLFFNEKSINLFI